MKYLVALLLPCVALAQTTYTVTGPTLNGTTYASQAACVAAAEALPAPSPGSTSTATCTVSIVATTPLPPPSANGAFITGTGALTDNAGTAWTLNAGVVYEQPLGIPTATKAGYSAGVGLLLWFNGAIHQRNPACLWWAWNGTAWFTESAPAATVPACATASPSGTVITGASQSITDAAFNTWTLAAGVVMEAPQGGTPAAAGFSANVIALAYVNGVIYQENSSCQWYGWNAAKTPPWTLGAAPALAAAPSCKPPVTGSAGVVRCGNKLCSTATGAPMQIIGDQLDGFEESFSVVRSALIAAQSVSWWQNTFTTQHPGENLVRFHLDTCAYLADTACAPGTDGKNAAQVQQAVAAARAAGLLVELDEAWSAPTGQQSIGQPGWPDAAHSIPFWKSIANTFKGDQGVLFELFNEPFGANNFNAWSTTDVPFNANGGTYAPFVHQNNSNNNALETVNSSYAVAGEIQLLAAIRAEGAPNLVLVSPTGWAGNVQTWLQAGVCPTDTLNNCAASFHIYGYNGGWGPIQAVLNAGYPVAITEFMGSSAAIAGSGGNLGSLASVFGQGVSEVVHCCANVWGGTSVTLVPW